ncbi:MAG: ABC transporter permease [Clostridiales Family XIII bacterium]|jgi:NitT/TauT family transport system permease protein|nr:ABC transporter permease [Clostridiales Family XIII bacterium]
MSDHGIRTSKAGKKIARALFASASTLIFILIWYILSSAGILNPGTIPGPVDVFAALIRNLFATDMAAEHILPTIRRAVMGFAFATGVGVGIGLLFSSILKSLKPVVVPIFHFLEKLNPLALFPVIMLFAGIGEESKVLIIFWVVVWIVVFHTIAGVENVDTLYLQSAKSMGAGGFALMIKVILPAAAPEIFSGVKFGANIAFIFVISVEMLSASSGLGWFIANAKHQYNLANLYSTVILVAIVGIIVSSIFNILERRLFSWKQSSIPA